MLLPSTWRCPVAHWAAKGTASHGCFSPCSGCLQGGSGCWPGWQWLLAWVAMVLAWVAATLTVRFVI